VIFSAIFAFLGLPVVFAVPLSLEENPLPTLLYFLSFVLLVSISLKLVAFFSMTLAEKVYVTIVVASLEFVVWHWLAAGSFSPILNVKTTESGQSEVALSFSSVSPAYSPASVFWALLLTSMLLLLSERLTKALKEE